MIVSHNELVSVVNKAFLGMRRTCGEADVIASMVAGLQIVGLNGIGHFNNAAQFLTAEKDCPVDIFTTNNGGLLVDLHGCSLACHLPVVIDYAIEKMVGKKHLTIELKNCHNRWLAYNELVKLAAKGLACKAQWNNGSAPHNTLYILNQGCVSPELFLSDHLDLEEGPLHDMTIQLSVRNFDIANCSVGYTKHINSSVLNRAQRDTWYDGILVDDAEWETLKKTATALLVENSEQSIKGAGELV
ncbi:DUF3726 domain-containing protein [Moritella viscosa]|uniref:DUF3726 domain-containing protein n=1 Tax=Moritella viscosa TaxID=80854 RepID=A0A090KAA4_9GAMM|nr:DUF3726 domain-containing protein [Moritella viscosa]CED60793.1 putative uncharacterized protein [Moritella viscosa]SGY96367.1 Putative uncharacterized protein [Moritella viscosa]SGZ02020.1 Putative uncharacterized protein [Moritella viscosa]SGZ02479.1 Putative uncharacterized protein [Moritella viscosa]SGZ08918.1 Putative uncharacterized protein [Moritella viscosa]